MTVQIIPVIDDFKVGDTISLAGTVLLPAGDWVTNQPTGWLVANNAQAATLVVVLTALVSVTESATHAISIELGAATCAKLAALKYKTDVRFCDAMGIVMHSPPYIIDLQPAATGVTGVPA